MDKTPLLSLCIPTNGVIEWVFPVLDSIYSQNVDTSLFEVVITDNGNNEEFYKLVSEYQKKVDNLFYYKSSGYEFLSEPDSYKNAKGYFIKFINHRTKLAQGTLQFFIDWVKKNKELKPVVYFSNGVLKTNKVTSYSNFDSFVRGLSYWSSWSTGMAFWKDDFNKLEKDAEYNFLFPHTTILFNEKERKEYIIDDTYLLDEIPVGKVPKGRYNLFYAFGVEYVGIISDLLRQDKISKETFLYVKNKNKQFLVGLYASYILLRQKCSYNLTDYKNSLNVFYTHSEIKRLAMLNIFIRGLKLPLSFVKKIEKMFKRG